MLVFLGWFLVVGSLFWLYWQGNLRAYFHQDDVVELANIARWNSRTIFHLNNEHLNITYYPLLRLQWLLFGINFSGYLFFNLLLHALVLFLIFQVSFKTTRSFFWAGLAVWGMTINSNWFTVVWWVSGQMFLLTTVFALLSILVIIEIRTKLKSSAKKWWPYLLLYLFSVFPGLSWGGGLTWPIWPLLVYGIKSSGGKISLNKIGKTLILSQITLAIIYFSLIGDNLAVHTDPATWFSNPLAILAFMVVGISNTVVGRWLWPTENLYLRIAALLVASLVFLAMKPWKKFRNKHIFLGVVVVLGIYLTYALPRWRFGIGHAMANYYAYLPLSFIMISLVNYFSTYSSKKLFKISIASFFVILMVFSWIGFESWARDWVIRPQQTRNLFTKLNKLDSSTCLKNEYLPTYIVPQPRWRMDFIWPIFKKSNNPFYENNETDCLSYLDL